MILTMLISTTYHDFIIFIHFAIPSRKVFFTLHDPFVLLIYEIRLEYCSTFFFISPPLFLGGGACKGGGGGLIFFDKWIFFVCAKLLTKINLDDSQ